MNDEQHEVLARTAAIAREYLEGLPERPLGPAPDTDALRAALGGPLPAGGEAPAAVIGALARAADPGLLASAGPRYFGFVTGGSLPAALAADWLCSAWDQNAGLHVMSPAAAVVEETVAAWLVELLGLPPGTSTGFTSGCTMANFTALLAARHALLARRGWDVEAQGLCGAPELRVLVGEEAHASVFSALQMAGLGRDRVTRVAADDQGRMEPRALDAALAAGDAPAVVCAQAGNVNSGAFDPLAPIAGICRRHGAWLHVDGAFGLWAAASPALCQRLEGLPLAASWATDAHKWLNVPYDSGLVFVADAQAHRAAVSLSAPYLVAARERGRDGADWVPEASRRARAVPLWAALRSLGRRGLAEMIERHCALARRMAERLRSGRGVAILNEVVLDQVLVRFGGSGDAARDDARTQAVIDAVQREGTCWAGGTRWRGVAAMRISICNWSTTEADVDRSAAAILRSAEACPDGG